MNAQYTSQYATPRNDFISAVIAMDGIMMLQGADWADEFRGMRFSQIKRSISLQKFSDINFPVAYNFGMSGTEYINRSPNTMVFTPFLTASDYTIAGPAIIGSQQKLQTTWYQTYPSSMMTRPKFRVRIQYADSVSDIGVVAGIPKLIVNAQHCYMSMDSIDGNSVPVLKTETQLPLYSEIFYRSNVYSSGAPSSESTSPVVYVDFEFDSNIERYDDNAWWGSVINVYVDTPSGNPPLTCLVTDVDISFQEPYGACHLMSVDQRSESSLVPLNINGTISAEILPTSNIVANMTSSSTPRCKDFNEVIDAQLEFQVTGKSKSTLNKALFEQGRTNLRRTV